MKHINKPLNFLVAGGAGYIGSVTTALLLNHGHNVTVLDNLSTGHRQAVHPDARFVKGDISDKLIIGEICRESIDVILHFAAYIEVGESVLNPSKYYENNLIKSIRFLDNIREFGVQNIVFSSTAAVYGEPEITPLTEDAALHPVNPYGWTKLLTEQVLRDYGQSYNLRSVSLRYFNAGGASGDFGEGHHPESHLIPRILNSAASDSPIEVYGTDYNTRDGSCIRDYIHVKDLAYAHLMAAQYLYGGGKSDCFNLGSGNGFSVLEVISAAEKVVGRSIQYSIAPRREGDSAVLVASSEKAQRILGWEKMDSALENIVEAAWLWKQKFPDGYGE